jgi:hypothetical protein
MLRRLTVTILFLGAISSVANAQLPTRAEDLLASCSAKAASSEEHACQWYLKGFVDGLGAEPGSAKIITICFPEEGFSIGQVRRVVLTWLDDHPEKLHLYAAEAVRTALEKAFPCKK